MSDLEYLDSINERREGGRIVKILGRRRLAFFLPLYALLAVVALGVTLVTPRYQSTATLEVHRQSIDSGGGSEVNERLARVQQTIRTNAVVEEIVRRHRVFGDAFTEVDKARLLDRFRKSLAIERVDAEVVNTATGRESAATLAFDVKFRHPDPVIAHAVTEDIAARLLALSEESRRRSSAAAIDVLTKNAERMAGQAQALEQQLTDFRREHAGKLPEQTATNLQGVQSAQGQLLSVDAEARSLQEERAIVEAELEVTDPYGAMVTTTGERVLNNAENIRLLETQLAEARRRYSDQHPDIRRLERQLREARVAGGEAAAIGRDGPPTNPAYITLRSKLRSIDSRLASLRVTRNQLQRKVDRLERQVAGTPAIEKQYLSLQRDYEQAVSNLEDASEKVAAAQLDEAIGDSDTGDRLTLIEPASKPTEPDKPVRLSVGVLGSLLALFVALAVAVLVDVLDRSVRDVGDLLTIMNEPPLGVIGRIDSTADVVARNIGNLLIFAMPCLIAAFLYLRLG